jgi:TonB-dependent SusC/RagA subfamily outer membrane receptor
MQGIYIYLLKSMLVSGILLGYYWFVLRNKRFHFYNRFYLIGTLALSVILPLLDLNWYAIQEPETVSIKQIIMLMDQPASISLPAEAFTWEKLLFSGMLLVSTVFILLFIYGIARIYQIKRKSIVTSLEEFDFIETDHEDAPFSFFRNLFWRKDTKLDDEAGKNMLKHELVHIHENHSWDKVLVGLLSAQFWMNPFFWLIRKELEVIHEFIADEKTIENADPASLAAMLLESQYKGKFLNNGQSYFYSSIKRRIIMITNSKKPSYSYVRRLLVLPIAAALIILSSFTIKHLNNEATKQHEMLNEENFIHVNDTTPKPKQVQGRPLSKNYDVAITDEWAIFKDPKTHKELFRMPSKQLVLTPPDSTTASKFAIRKSMNLLDVLMDNTKSVDGVMFVGDTTVSYDNPLYVVDGHPVDNIKSLSPNDIESINVLKNESSRALYGPKGANGVIMITTKKGTSISTSIVDTVKAKEITVIGHPLSKEQKEQKEITVTGYGSKKDGIKVEGETLTLTTPDLIIVQKALEKQNVVRVEVEEKEGKKQYKVIRKNDTEIKKTGLPSDILYIVDGKEITEKEMKDISPTTIESINVWKGEKAIEKYGTKGNNGVVEIHLKKK